MVDTSERPYSFKFIVGIFKVRTIIYYSKRCLWITTSLRLKVTGFESPRQPTYSCIYVYGEMNEIFKYSMKEDVRSTIIVDVPPELYSRNSLFRIFYPIYNVIGMWEGQIYTTKENIQRQYALVWKLIDEEEQMWVEYAWMLKEEYKWIYKCDLTPSI